MNLKHTFIRSLGSNIHFPSNTAIEFMVQETRFFPAASV